jgi:hypothetical protein
LIYYYGASSWGKNHPEGIRLTGGGIFRARLRPDGFVSIDGGTLTSVPLRFDGTKLFVNAVGPLKVEALDRFGEVLGAAMVVGDSLNHAVTFTGRTLAQAAPEGSVRLRFSLSRGAALYSFTIL